jgi:hypothetical protein
MTMVVLMKPDSYTAQDIMSLHTSGGKGTGYELYQDGGKHLALGVDPASTFGSDPINLSEWQLFAVSKAAGTATPRFHNYGYSSATWDHRNGSGTIGNGASVSGGTVRFGAWENSFYAEGEYAAAALFSRSLSDAEVEALAGSYEKWLKLDPAGMWIFNQRDLTKPVLDETGGGADEYIWGGNGTEVHQNLPMPTGDPDETIFRGDLIRNNYEEWVELQKVGATSAFSIGNSSPPPGESYYARSELKKGDERAELRSALNLFEGEDVYVRFWARLQSGFPLEEAPPVWGQLIWQDHESGIGTPQVALHVTGNGAGNGKFALRDHKDELWWQGPSIDTGKWHEFIIRVNHSQDSGEGFVEAWMDGVHQTMASGSKRKYGATMDDEYNYLKTGYYRDYRMNGTGSVDIAGFRVSRSMGDLP